MSVTSILICLFCMIAFGKSIPPSQCFEPFNYDDCGRSPQHVLYYYKPGSRCEVAIWRGCPTRNMFKDEYECISTCITVERVNAEDYHNFGLEDDYQMPLDYGANDTIEDQETTTEAGENTTEADGENATDSGSGAGELELDTAADGDAGSAKEGDAEEGAETEDPPAEGEAAEGEPAEGEAAEGEPAEEAPPEE